MQGLTFAYVGTGGGAIINDGGNAITIGQNLQSGGSPQPRRRPDQEAAAGA